MTDLLNKGRVVYICLIGCVVLGLPQCHAPLASPSSLMQDVTISIANEDLSAPIALISVRIDDSVVFRGPVSGTVNGQYIYLTTRLPTDTGVSIVASSRTQDGVVEATKEVWIRSGIWIVIAQESLPDAPPHLEISVSYEKDSKR
jgi:hypothetical protein